MFKLFHLLADFKMAINQIFKARFDRMFYIYDKYMFNVKLLVLRV